MAANIKAAGEPAKQTAAYTGLSGDELEKL